MLLVYENYFRQPTKATPARLFSININRLMYSQPYYASGEPVKNAQPYYQNTPSQPYHQSPYPPQNPAPYNPYQSPHQVVVVQDGSGSGSCPYCSSNAATYERRKVGGTAIIWGTVLFCLTGCCCCIPCLIP